MMACSKTVSYNKGQMAVVVSITALTHDHKLRCLKQHPFIIPQFLWVRSLGTAEFSA